MQKQRHRFWENCSADGQEKQENKVCTKINKFCVGEARCLIIRHWMNKYAYISSR
jgi:hypothetical protein